MKKLVERISLFVIATIFICVVASVLPAQAAAKWKFSSSDGKKKAEVSGTITVKKNDRYDMNLYKDGKEIKTNNATYTVSWYSSDTDVVYVDKKTGKFCADKFGEMKTDSAEAKVTAVIKNKKTGSTVKKSFTVKVESAVKYNEKSATVMKQDGFAVTKLPYKTKGLIIEKISFGKYSEVNIIVKNMTGNAIDGLSSIEYKLYDKDGAVLKKSSMYLDELNNGEALKKTFYITDDTYKIVFGEAEVRKGVAWQSVKTAKSDGIVTNKLPYITKGVAITAVSNQKNVLDITIKNKNEYPLGELSYIPYKEYDKNDVVLNVSSVYLDEINGGEYGKTSLYLNSDTAKIVFGEGTIKKGVKQEEVAITEYDGFFTNTLPYNTEGIVIHSLEIDKYMAVEIIVENKNDYAISGLSSIPFKEYDASGNLLKSSNIYLHDLEAGEFGKVNTYFSDDVQKVVFGKCEIRRGVAAEEKELTQYDGIIVNTLPYTSEGISVLGLAINSYGSAEIWVKNESGYAIAGTSSISYKQYDEEGYVLGTGTLYLEDLNDGDTYLATAYFDADVAVLVFGEAEVRKGIAFKNTKTVNVGGFEMTKLPYEVDGVVVSAIEISKNNEATITVKNASDSKLKSDDRMTYKVFDENGYVLGVSTISLNELEPGEISKKTVYLPYGATKLILGEME